MSVDAEAARYIDLAIQGGDAEMRDALRQRRQIAPMSSGRIEISWAKGKFGKPRIPAPLPST